MKAAFPLQASGLKQPYVTLVGEISSSEELSCVAKKYVDKRLGTLLANSS